MIDVITSIAGIYSAIDPVLKLAVYWIAAGLFAYVWRKSSIGRNVRPWAWATIIVGFLLSGIAEAAKVYLKDVGTLASGISHVIILIGLIGLVYYLVKKYPARKK